MSFQNALLGSLIADAVSMPVHWYYDTDAIDKDFPDLSFYQGPKKVHPDSILWRSSYKSRSKAYDILGEQAEYYGKRDTHYHQFLEPGENTLNLKLAVELYKLVIKEGGYDATAWVERYKELMLNPSWHRDTYLEEHHRNYFTKISSGVNPLAASSDSTYIGSLSQIPALLAALEALELDYFEASKEICSRHVGLTHESPQVSQAVNSFVNILFLMRDGASLKDAFREEGGRYISIEVLERSVMLEDRLMVGANLSTACYLPDSFTASLYLAYKYSESLESGLLANARVGGDNCHRGVVVGSLLAIENGVDENLLRGLLAMEDLRCDI